MSDPRSALLTGGRALVTGASRRIGRAIAECLARAGMDVAVHYRTDEDGALTTVRALEAVGRKAVVLRADLADPDACLHLVEEAEERIGPLTLLVNNAGVFYRTPLARMDAEDFDRHMEANARPVYLLSLHAGRRLKARGGGAIVNIADAAGLTPWAGYVPYSASKAAVVSLTLGFAKALAPEVRVNAVAPGPILPSAGAPPEEGERAVASTLLGRYGQPEDVAEAVRFLAASPYVTGVVLPVDGGRTIA